MEGKESQRREMKMEGWCVCGGEGLSYISKGQRYGRVDPGKEGKNQKDEERIWVGNVSSQSKKLPPKYL